MIHDIKIKRTDWKNIILLSLFGVTLNIAAFFFGLEYSSAINAPVIGSSGPLFLYLFSILILREKPKPKILAGTLVSLSGVLLIVGIPLFLSRFDIMETIGNLLFVLATIGSVGHTIFSKEIIQHYKAATVTYWSFIIGTYTFAPFFIYEMIKYHPFTTIDNRGWLGIIFGIFLSSAAGYLLFEWGIKQLDGQEIGIFAYIDPIVAAILAILLLGESITLPFLIGAALIFGGIYIAEGRIHYHPLHKLRLK